MASQQYHKPRRRDPYDTSADSAVLADEIPQWLRRRGDFRVRA